jgi:hypothetical protein
VEWRLRPAVWGDNEGDNKEGSTVLRGFRGPAGSSRRCRLVVSAGIAAAAVGIGSVAWACVPSIDKRTLIQSCTAPSSSGRLCKVPIGQPAFPEATFVKGPAGSNLLAYVEGDGMEMGVPYDLLFLGKPLVTAGNPCASSAATVISSGAPGPVGNTNGGINPTAGTIPANAPIGGGQICFADRVNRSVSSSEPATFKVVV